MNTIVITSRHSISLAEVSKVLSRHWSVYPGAEGRLVIEAENQRIYAYRPKRAMGAGPREELYLDYSGLEFVKKIIPLIADDPEMIVDNEHGTVWFGDLFDAYLKAHPEWNWRDEAP